MTNLLTNIEALAAELGNDLDRVATELKRVQSVKCRLKKAKGKATYEADMKNCLAEEQALKEVRQLLDLKEKPVTAYTQADVDELDYDETVKAIRSIQSKKTLSKWLTTEPGDNDTYRSAVRIEEMLLIHKKTVSPIDADQVRKTDVQTIIDTIESNQELSKERLLEMLATLTK